MAEYRDFFLRQSLREEAPGHAGGTASPDVVPWGAEQDPDPESLSREMGVDPGRPLVAGQTNYVYVRARNADPKTDRAGQLFVGSAPPAFLTWPDTLKEIPNTGGHPYFLLAKVKPDAVGVSTTPFAFVPSSAGDTLCGWVFTREHPVRPPALDGVPGLVRFLGEAPGYAQRSVCFGLTSDHDYRFVGAYAQRDQPATMMFAIQTRDCRGFTVSLRPVGGGDAVKILPTTLPNDNSGVMVDVDLPAGFETTLEFLLETNGQPLRPTARAQVVVLTMDDDADAVALLDLDVTAEVRAFPLGGHEWRATDALPA